MPHYLTDNAKERRSPQLLLDNALELRPLRSPLFLHLREQKVNMFTGDLVDHSLYTPIPPYVPLYQQRISDEAAPSRLLPF